MCTSRKKDGSLGQLSCSIGEKVGGDKLARKFFLLRPTRYANNSVYFFHIRHRLSHAEAHACFVVIRQRQASSVNRAPVQRSTMLPPLTRPPHFSVPRQTIASSCVGEAVCTRRLKEPATKRFLNTIIMEGPNCKQIWL